MNLVLKILFGNQYILAIYFSIVLYGLRSEGRTIGGTRRGQVFFFFHIKVMFVLEINIYVGNDSQTKK